MTDDDSKQNLFKRHLEWHRTIRSAGETAWDASPTDKKGTKLVNFSAPAILICMFIPYISFDAAGPGETHVYPMGESIALIDDSDFAGPVFTILCIVFASRFSKHRTDWSYRLLWFCVIMTALNVFGVLFALWPGWVGYSLWSTEAYGDLWASNNLQQSMSNGTFDYWAKLTNIEFYGMYFLIGLGCLLVRGAWYLRETRHVDKRALAEHQRRLVADVLKQEEK